MALITGVTPALQALKRNNYAVGIYRGLVGLAFLVACFNTFSSAIGPIALGYIFFGLSTEAVGLAVSTAAQAQNRLSDLAERKTRHTIVLAAQAPWRDRQYEPDWDFWAEVNRRVAEEGIDEDAPSVPWWKTLGLVLGNVALRAAIDVATIVFAAVLAGA